MGGFGVGIFFAISGYLVSGSWHADPRPTAFLGKRALRVLPGLMAAVVVSAYVIGPLFTTRTLGDYFTDPRTSSYVLHNLILETRYGLPGVFTGNGSVVNGSLWSLPIEVRAYLLLLVVGALQLLRRPLAPALAAAAFAVVSLPTFDTTAASNAASLLVSYQAGVLPVAIFFAAAALYGLRGRIPLDWRLALAATAAFLALGDSSPVAHVVVWTVCLPYVVVFLALRGPGLLSRLTGPGDASYGMYLYGYPIEQSFVAMFPGISGAVLLLASAPVSYLAGVASWRLVEARALRLKARLPVRPAALPRGHAAQEPSPAG